MRFILPFFALSAWLLTPAELLAQRSEYWREKPGTWLLNVGLGATHYVGDLNERSDLAHLRLGTSLDVAAAFRYSPQLTLRGEAQLYFIQGKIGRAHV